MVHNNLNLDKIFDEVENAVSFEYRNPLGPPFSDPERTTRSQQVAWDYLQDMLEAKNPAVIAMIGAKGSAKTHFGSAFAFEQGQRFPESLGCIISNSYSQAKDNAGTLFMEMARRLGFKTEFFGNKKIKGQSLTNVYVVDLDGRGFEEGKNFYALLRSFDAVNKLEGIQLDWLWVEEIQDAEKINFQTVYSRVRGKKAINNVFVAGMPREELHWMYKLLPKLGSLEEKKREQGEKVFNSRGNERFGIMLEPTVFENKKNLSDGYIDNLFDTYDKSLAEWYIYGRRTSLKSNKVCYNYADHIHRTGRMSKLLSEYDKSLPIVISFDFNAHDMWTTTWQIKEWNDSMDDPSYLVKNGNLVWRDKTDDLVKLDELPGNWRDVLVQIDELHVTSGGTRRMAEKLREQYGRHRAGITIIGDATGQREYSTASQTDWQIVQEVFAKVPNTTILRGLVSNSDLKKGTVKYDNPARRDTINALNASLMDARDRTWICFMPESPYEDTNGGAVRAVAMLERKPDGRVDDSVDRSEDDDQYKTHPFDTVRYVNWWFRGDEAMYSSESFNEMMGGTTDIIMDKSEFASADDVMFGGGGSSMFSGGLF